MSGQRQPHRKMAADGARAENTDTPGVEVPVRGTMIGRLVSTSSAGSATRGVGRMSDTLALSFQAPAPPGAKPMSAD